MRNPADHFPLSLSLPRMPDCSPSLPCCASSMSAALRSSAHRPEPLDAFPVAPSFSSAFPRVKPPPDGRFRPSPASSPPLAAAKPRRWPTQRRRSAPIHPEPLDRDPTAWIGSDRSQLNPYRSTLACFAKERLGFLVLVVYFYKNMQVPQINIMKL